MANRRERKKVVSHLALQKSPAFLQVKTEGIPMLICVDSDKRKVNHSHS